MLPSSSSKFELFAAPSAHNLQAPHNTKSPFPSALSLDCKAGLLTFGLMYNCIAGDRRKATVFACNSGYFICC